MAERSALLPRKKMMMNDKSRRVPAGKSRLMLGGVALLAFTVLGASQAPTQLPQMPVPTVPEIFTGEGQFVRMAYNNEGYVTMGYRVAQESVGEEWILLDVGFTLRKPTKDYVLKREHLSVKLPDGSVVPLATQKEYAQAGYLRALAMKTKTMKDSINYFPMDAFQGAALRFFASPGSGGPSIAYDETELSSTRATLGRIYFHVPGGIKIGQHWLQVKFASSEVHVPFRIFTPEEKKMFEKRWQDIKKAHDEAMRQQ
jgi:hypothetical protein